MPGNKVPVELCGFPEDWSTEETGKAMSDSSRSSSPKSLTESWASSPVSVSEASESPEGSVISDGEMAEIANDLDNMKITELQAETLQAEGADMRHVLQAAYQLKPKYLGKMKFKKGTKLLGTAVLDLLNFDNYREKEEDQEQRNRMSKAWAQYEQRQMKGKGMRPPPGFSSLDQTIAKKFTEEFTEEPDFLVSYANGTNTLNLANESIVVHDVTVSCVVDSCRVFIQHMKNPTFEGLKHLENEIGSTYAIEQPKALLRPIAQGSVLGVFSDSKWYRCQVVSYNPKDDTCDIKFVDHGGYTTVPAGDLRQLKPDFLRLPFQAIETYLSGVNPAIEEIQKDIASEILFHGNVSIKLLGQADDGIPMIQAYYYDGDYINIFTQEIIDSCSILSDSSSETSQEESPVTQTPEVEEVPLPYEAAPYPDYSYYGPEAAYTVMDPNQPTIAYCYLDHEGNQQVYYVAGPYIVPAESISLTTSQESLLTPSEESSPVSFGWSEEGEETVSSDTPASSYTEEEVEVESKPFEEWTQEDYALYYGLS